MIDRTQIAAWEALVAHKRGQLAQALSTAEAENLRSEIQRVETLIDFYKTSVVDTAA